MQGRHVVEVHAIDATDEGGHDEDGSPGRDLLEVLVALLVHQRRVDGEHLIEQLPDVGDLVDDARQVVGDVAQISLQALGDLMLVESGPQRADDGNERVDGTLQVHRLAGESVDALRGGRVTGEHLVLNLLDVLLQAVNDRVGLVDHPIQDGVQHRFGSLGEHVGIRGDAGAP